MITSQSKAIDFYENLYTIIHGKVPYGYIYVIRNSVNEKVCIGKTTDLKGRIRDYKYQSKDYERSKIRKIFSAMNVIGFDKFTFEIIDCGFDEYDLNKKEKYWIEIFDATNPNCGYNSSSGGDGGIKKQGRPQSVIEKKIRSQKVIAYKDNKFVIADSGKLFGDYINMARTNITRAVKHAATARGYYVFYYDNEKRKEIVDKVKYKLKNDNITKPITEYNYKKIIEIDELITRGVTTRFENYDVEYLAYE